MGRIGSTSYVLPIRLSYRTLNRVMRVGLNVKPEIQTLNELYFQRVRKIVIVKKSPISVHLVIEKISIWIGGSYSIIYYPNRTLNAVTVNFYNKVNIFWEGHIFFKKSPSLDLPTRTPASFWIILVQKWSQIEAL